MSDKDASKRNRGAIDEASEGPSGRVGFRGLGLASDLWLPALE